jgi:uncharacterized RDD family membrane protein YckC
VTGEGQADETILALDNVPLELPIAGVGSRILAGFLDYTLVGLLMGGFVALALYGSVVGRRAGFLGPGWWFALVILGLFVIEYGYFAGLEVALGGRTFGKRALGLRVVTREGGRPGPAALLLRNTVRLGDLLVGVPLMALDPLARRLGDRLAGTLVVHARPRERDLVLGRVPRGWSGREVAVAESFLRRAGDLEPQRARPMARRLLELIERDDPSLMAGIEPDRDPVETLRRVLGVEA